MPGGGVSEDLFERGLCLPSGTQMTEEDLNRVVNFLRRCCKNKKMVGGDAFRAEK